MQVHQGDQPRLPPSCIASLACVCMMAACPLHKQKNEQTSKFYISTDESHTHTTCTHTHTTCSHTQLTHTQLTHRHLAHLAHNLLTHNLLTHNLPHNTQLTQTQLASHTLHTRDISPSLCVAGVVILTTSIVTLRGRPGTYGTGLALAARLVSHGAVTPRRFAWQAWHFVTSTFTLCGRRGT